MKVLIVDDSANKTRLISQCLVAELGIPPQDIYSAIDVISAKKCLIDDHFDLLLIDILLPLRIDEAPVADGGFQLLDCIGVDLRLQVPLFIIGITGQEDLHLTAIEQFSSRLWAAIYIDEAGTEWKDKIVEKVGYLRVLRERVKENIFSQSVFDIAIVAALNKPELSAVLKLDCHWERYKLSGDPTIYHRGIIQAASGTLSIVAASPTGMGMSLAASLTVNMKRQFNPRYFFMLGIMAGIESRCDIGDVIVSDPCWDWGCGKYLWDDESKEESFRQQQNQERIGAKYRALFSDLARENAYMDSIYEDEATQKPDTRPILRIGPVASGAAVIASEKILSDIVGRQHKLLGIDMEIFGFMAGLHAVSDSETHAIGLKSVCDLGDSSKDDDWQEYAANNSAQFFYRFATDHL